MTDLVDWLRSLGLEKYEEVLRAHDVDLAIASELTEQDLEKLGLSLGHRRKFIAAAAKLRRGEGPAAAPTRRAAPDARWDGDCLLQSRHRLHAVAPTRFCVSC